MKPKLIPKNTITNNKDNVIVIMGKQKNPKTNKIESVVMGKMTPVKPKPKFVDDAHECRICGDEFENEQEKEPLRCGHVFHYDCIIYAFQAPTTLRTCPYCRKYHGYLRLIEGIEPIKSIHKDISMVKNNLVCQALYKSGLKAGTQCTSKKKGDSNYCGIHKNYGK